MRAFPGAAYGAQWLVATALLGACVPTPLERAAAPVAPAAPLAAFEVSGRLSVRHGRDGLAASFHWRHATERDELDLTSPLGQTAALLTGDASQVQLQTADGRLLTASDWQALTEQGLGWPLPLQGLSFWIQGSARPGATFSIESGDDGRAGVLRQDGWTIVYQAYAQASDASWRPSRLTLSYPDVELRIAIDRWP